MSTSPLGSVILLVSLIFLATSTMAAPVFTGRRFRQSVQSILDDILYNYFPQCDIILLQDNYFTENMNAWVKHIPFPYYSITLDGKRFPDYTTWQKITKTTGFLCSTIVAVCTTFESCRNSDSPTLFKMLSANGILLKERRAILYIDRYSDKDDLPYSFSNPHDKWSMTHEDPFGEAYSLSVMNKAKHILSELMSHITIIRDMTGKLNGRKTRRYFGNMTSNLDRVPDFHNDVIYETLTFSPNWIPGGTPLVPNLWSKKRGFALPHPPLLDLSEIKPGGVVRFCIPNRNLLPFIDVANDGTILGFDAEVVHLFRRYLEINAEFFEPRDKSYSAKDKNGNWSGPIGFVFRKEADISMGQVTYTHDKKVSGLKFSPLVVTLNAVAVCPIPKLLPRYQILAYPFETTTWICLLISFVVSVGIIEVLQRVAIHLMPMPMQILLPPKTCRRQKRSKIEKSYQSKLAWIQSIGSIFQRSITVNMLPPRWAILGLFSVWLLFTSITADFYVTLLIGSLSVPPREPYVRSPADLVNSKTEWAVSSIVNQAIESTIIPSEVNLLKGSKSITNLPEYKNLPSDIQVYSYVNTTGNCAVTEEYRAKFYIGSKFTVKNRDRNRRQLLYVSEGSFFISASGWVMRDDMDFLLESYFDKIFLEVSCFGLHDKIIHEWLPEEFQVNHPIEPLNLDTVQVVFVFGSFGLLGSCVIFVCEVIVFRVRAGVAFVRSRFLRWAFKKLKQELFPFVW